MGGGRLRSRRRSVAVLTVLMVFALSGCPTEQPSGSPAASASGLGVADRIVVGLLLPPFAPPPFLAISNTTAAGFRPSGTRADLAVQLVYSGLYRYDDTLAPVPDLAAEPCEVAADQVTITCTLVETTFHDGTPLTADDVAYTYELGRRHPDCLWAFFECYGHVLESVTALDERTVQFHLLQPDATFLTLILPNVMIDSRAVIEAAYAPLGEAAPSLDAGEYQAASVAIFAELGSPSPDCESPLPDAEALLEAATIERLPRDQFAAADGSLDVCRYAEWTAIFLSSIARSLQATGLDAVALAYQTLAFNRAPVGTGPWKFVRVEDGNRAVFEANDAYHLGPPATRSIEMWSTRDEAAAVEAFRNGDVDWVGIPIFFPDMYEALRGEEGVQFVSFPDSTYYMLAYNLRDGMLFADRNLRAAVEACVDKPSTVDAATNGHGDVLYSPVEPVSWAFQTDLPRRERDVAEGRRLIESSGWTEGPDGIYEKGGRRLATDVFVGSYEEARVQFMDLVAEQVRDCGVELTVIPADFVTVLEPLGTYPHIPGGYDTPFEAVFIGWSHGFDPHDRLWSSETVTSEAQPNEINFMGFADQRVDELLAEGIATYDQRERARVYREFQQVLLDEHPVLFAWAARIRDTLAPGLGLTDGDVNLESRFWYWQLEKLVLREE